MYGVTEQMSQQSSREPIEPTARQSTALSPELREVLHMLDTIEQDVKARGSAR